MLSGTIDYSITVELIEEAIKEALVEVIKSKDIPYEVSSLTLEYSSNDSDGIITANTEFKPNDPAVTFALDSVIVTLVNPENGTLIWYWDEGGYHVKLNEAIDIVKYFFRDNKPIAKNIKLQLYQRSENEKGDQE